MSEQMTAPAVPAQTDHALVRARKLGRHAGLNGEPVTKCPYKVDGSARQKVLALNWLRARRAVDPSSVSYEGDQAVPGE